MIHEHDRQEAEQTFSSTEEEVKAGTYAAQWFVLNAGMSLDEALKAVNLTREQFNRYKDTPGA